MLRPPAMLLFTAVLLPLLTLQLSSAAALDTHPSPRHRRSASPKVDLDALKENLASIEDGLSNFQKRSCAVGLNSHHCAIAHLDNLMMGSEYLGGGFSPGKRNTELPEDIKTRADILLQNLSEQMKAVSTLRRLLNQLGQEAKQQEKRTCQFRLGNHCLTEALDRAASQYYYLQSPLSPGRRRRQVAVPDSQGLDNALPHTGR